MPKNGVKIPSNKIIVPSAGDFYLRCGNCGGMSFTVHVQPFIDQGKPSVCECITCKRFFNIDHDGFIVGSGRIEYTNRRTT